jgi:cell division protein FtsB
VKEQNSFLLELGKTLVSTVIATACAAWTARGMLADYDRRIAVVETQQQNLASAFNKSNQDVTNALNQIHDDFRAINDRAR